MVRWMGISALSCGLMANAFAGGTTLQCPAGTKAVSIPDGSLVSHMCQATSGDQVFHGPYEVRTTEGRLQVSGQMEHGHRTGKWLFFDEAGRKMGETEFLAGDYHGERKEFYPNGKVKLIQHFAKGRQQGAEQRFDAEGHAIHGSASGRGS